MKFLSSKSSAVRSLILVLAGAAMMFTFGSQAYAAPIPIWMANPSSCPWTDAQYPGVNCFPENICGDDGGVPQCYNTVPLAPPAGSVNSSTIYDGALGGGYVIDCAAPKDAGAPFCDNNTAFWCNSDTSCYTAQHRQTTCNGGLWASAGAPAFACGACRGGYGDCDLGGDDCEIQYNTTPWPGGLNSNYKTCIAPQCNSGYYDCGGVLPAGDQCATQNGAACIGVGGFSGTMTCALNPAGACNNGDGAIYDCTCVVPPQDFQTGVDAEASTVNPLLWGTQFGTGDLFNLSKDVLGVETEMFQVNNDGTVQITSIGAPGVTVDRLYNVGGALTWNGVALGGAQDFEGVFTTDALKNLDTSGATFTIDTTVGAAGDFVVTSTDWSVDAAGNANFAGTLTGGTVTDGTFSVTGGVITGASGSNSMWANDENYITAADVPAAETDPVFGAWDKSTGISITEGQISDLQAYELAADMAADVPANETDPVWGAWIAANPNADTDSTNDVVTDGSSAIATGNTLTLDSGATLAVNGKGDFSTSSEFHLREDPDPATNATCTTLGELIFDTTDKEIQVCTFIASPGTWVNTAAAPTVLPVFVGLTTGTYDGDLAAGGTGYNEANAICDAEGGAYTGSHMCSTSEIIYSIAGGAAGWVGGTQGWISNGPPGYTSNSNDCSGWTNNSNTGYYGAFWDFTVATGGKGWMAPCNVSKKLACCK